MPIELSPEPEFKMFVAYLDFLDDGKLTTFAKLAVKYPEASSLFIRAIEDLDSGRVYPFAVTRLPPTNCGRERSADNHTHSHKSLITVCHL